MRAVTMKRTWSARAHARWMVGLAMVVGTVPDPGAAGCIQIQAERELWLEIESCSTETVARAADVLFLQSLESPSRDRAAPVAFAQKLVQRSPAVLVEARTLAFIEIPSLVMKSDEEGRVRWELEGTRGRWQAAETPEPGSYLLFRSEVSCDGLEAGAKIVVRGESSCCDVVPPSDLTCLLARRPVTLSARSAPDPSQIESKKTLPGS